MWHYSLTFAVQIVSTGLILSFLQDTYDVHCRRHWEVKGVIGGLVFHNSFIPEK